MKENRDQSPLTNAGDPDNISTANSTSFKYKSSFFELLEAADNEVFKNVKIAVPIKYLSNFWRSLEMPLTVKVISDWTKDCLMSTIADTAFKITNTVIRSNCYFIQQRQCKTGKTIRRFKRPVYWNEYQTKTESRNLRNNNLTRFPFDASFQGVRRSFVLAFNNTTVNVPHDPINNTNNKVERNSYTIYFLQRVNITNYDISINGRNFYDQPINDFIKQYDEVRKASTGQGEDYTTGYLLNYHYFKDHYRPIAVYRSTQKELDADSRAIQQN